MNNFIFLLLMSTCTFSKSASSPHSLIWKHINATGRDSFEKHLIQNNDKVKIPYLNEEVNYLFFDSLIDKGREYDSLLNEYANKKTMGLPTPVIAWTKKFVIVYSNKQDIKINSCEQPVYSFLINKGSEFNEHDCYHLYYLQGFGIIACVHEIIGEMPIGWDKYLLSDIWDKKGNSILEKETLKLLLEKVITLK